MEEYVKFSGKDVDDAIANACKHFGIDRDRLEIDIISGGSSGIFGLVGVKRAKILAKQREIPGESESSESLNAESHSEDLQQDQPGHKDTLKPQPGPKQEPVRKTKPKAKTKRKPKTKPRSKAKPEQAKNQAAQDTRQQAQADEKIRPGPSQNADKASQKGADSLTTQSEPEHKRTETKTEALDESDIRSTEGNETDAKQETAAPDPELQKYIHSLMVSLTAPLAPETDITVNEQTRPISVTFKDESTSEVLIGRDGQTLSAIQYIANRIIAKNRPGAARVQLDTENFLEKQNEKLQQNAFMLASKAIKAGKTMSTKPLSSYHRRIVHMALQDDKKIRTKSKGDGPMKRVLIMPKQRRKKSSQD